ncbi:unnamed protein product [Pipistrellus nathusii]|uniref:Uncharacterized protein n=1 Tax=Pipistrellus nathusii TaxID=59473 RepID=A0ABN9ZR45_PIPNA
MPGFPPTNKQGARCPICTASGEPGRPAPRPEPASSLRLLLYSPRARDALYVFKNRDEYVTETLRQAKQSPQPCLTGCVGHTAQAGAWLKGSKQYEVMHATELLAFEKQTAS